MNRFDVIIIGAGAVGCAVARELSLCGLSVAVIDKEYDVAAHTSGRNSAVSHAGFNNKTSSLMAELCVEGNLGMAQLCRELDVPFIKTGKLLVAFDEEDVSILQRLIRQGENNGCEGLAYIRHEKLSGLEPYVGGIGAMWSPNTAILDPFLYSVALAEHAFFNGARFFFGTEVTELATINNGWVVNTDKGSFSAKCVVNSAGLYSDEISAMAGKSDYKIYPCRGEYIILDKAAAKFLNHPLYPAPKPGIGGLGIHLTPTIDGNIIIGPSNEYIEDKTDFSCTEKVLKQLFEEAKTLLPPIEASHVIGHFAGIRPKLAPPSEGGFRDFVIEELKSGFINLVGIESPGLTASVPIAKRVAAMLDAERKTNTVAPKSRNRRFRDLTLEEKRDWGGDEIVCRCENVTRREIREAIENPLGVRTIAGIKYRARATMGRCGGGYCLPVIAEMLVNEYGMKPEDITLRGGDSYMFAGKLK